MPVTEACQVDKDLKDGGTLFWSTKSKAELNLACNDNQQNAMQEWK